VASPSEVDFASRLACSAWYSSRVARKALGASSKGTKTPPIGLLISRSSDPRMIDEVVLPLGLTSPCRSVSVLFRRINLVLVI
jgi:hypothetical protein